VANKTDLLIEDRSRLESRRKLAARKKLPFFAVSAHKADSLRPLVAALADLVRELKASAPDPENP